MLPNIPETGSSSSPSLFLFSLVGAQLGYWEVLLPVMEIKHIKIITNFQKFVHCKFWHLITIPILRKENKHTFKAFKYSSNKVKTNLKITWAIVTPESNLLSSSSLRMANWRWRGMIRVFLLSLAAFPEIKQFQLSYMA